MKAPDKARSAAEYCRERQRPKRMLALAMAWMVMPFSTLASDWVQTSASGMEDVAVGHDGSIWLAGENGTVWTSPDGGLSFKKVEASGFARIAVAPNGTVWAVGSNQSLWKFADGHWTKTSASGIGDVAVTASGSIWLAGKNGSVWFSNDQGQTFKQVEASGFSRISAGDDVVWAVGFNGSLWKRADGAWKKTSASGMQDVGVAPNGTLWLAGKNGTVWTSLNDGVTFTQVEGANGFESIAATSVRTWAVGTNGTLWKYQ